MIVIRKNDTEKILELGGGENPHPYTNVNLDARPGPTVHIPWDISQLPLPLSSNEWDVVLAVFLLEHISYRLVPPLLKEIHRIIKPGGRTVLVTPNTAEQINWIETHPQGWDGLDDFTSFSCVLFGGQQAEYGTFNSHQCYLSSKIIKRLLVEAGFVDIENQPYGIYATDMVTQGIKPL